jgi:beta-N-acetylhexosaminidase
MKVSEFNPRQLAGQRLMIGFDGIRLTEDLRQLIDHLYIGGVILFSRNIVDPEQVLELSSTIQTVAREAGLPPLFIAVDQEGGTVARLKEPFTRLPSAKQMEDPEMVRRYAGITAYELGGVGINMNMAPVMDVAPTDIESIMSERSFGPDPDRVSKMGIQIIEQLQRNNIMAVAKHFPGIGRTTIDSHVDRPNLAVDLDALKASDLIPFQAALGAGVAGMMLSHIFYEALDSDWPASLSPYIVDTLLRKEMGFDGVIMTDDLDMGAIKKYYDIKTVIRQILTAGIDMALICHAGPDIETAHREITTAIDASSDIRDRCRTAVRRILALKQQYLTL